MAKKRKTASTRKKPSHKRKTSAKKKSGKTRRKARKAKAKAKPARKPGPKIGATFTATEAFLLTADQKLKIYAQVLACLRRLLNDDHVIYTTKLRDRYGWDNENFIQIASDLPRCFKNAGWTIPRPLSKPALAKCKTVEDVCAVVVAAYQS